MIIMIIYVGIALYTDVGKLSKSVLRIDYSTIPLILIPMTIAIVLLAVRYHRLLRAIGINISIKGSISIYVAGLSLLVTPASSGLIIKSQVIKSQFGYAISRTSPIVFIEKWSELTSILLILIVCTAIHPIFESMLIIVVGIALALIFVGIMKNPAFFAFFKRSAVRFPRLKKWEESIENSKDTLKVLSSKKAVFEGFIFATPAEILQAVSVFFAFQAVGVKIGFVTSTQIFFTGLISGILSFIPGGFGITEASMLGLLIKYYNNDFALLAAAIIFVRLVTLWYSTCLGLITAQIIIKYKGKH
jgi:uncharacterized protein (TIRG00374 family)